MQTMLVPHYRDFAKIRREKVAIVAIKIFSKFENIWIKLRVDSRKLISFVFCEIVRCVSFAFKSYFFACNVRLNAFFIVYPFKVRFKKRNYSVKFLITFCKSMENPKTIILDFCKVF